MQFDLTTGAAGVFGGNRRLDFVAGKPRLTVGEMLLGGAGATLRLDGFRRPLAEAAQGGGGREHALRWQDRGRGGDCVHALEQHVVGHLHAGAPLENTGAPHLRNLDSRKRSSARPPPPDGRRWIALPGENDRQSTLSASGGRPSPLRLGATPRARPLDFGQSLI